MFKAAGSDEGRLSAVRSPSARIHTSTPSISRVSSAAAAESAALSAAASPPTALTVNDLSSNSSENSWFSSLPNSPKRPLWASSVSLVVPCHRALREDGGLGGYRWGLARKEALLELEEKLLQT